LLRPRLRESSEGVSWYNRRMRDLFDPCSFGPSHRDLTRYVAPARPSRRLDFFDVRTFGPQHGDRQLSRWRCEWHRHARWLATFTWPERLVIIIGEIAVAYLAFVFGLLVGVGLFG
jgi:hypothetical protein